ncbi:MAG: glycosyltransferase family 2 protein [Filifactoraceae bacterium]
MVSVLIPCYNCKNLIEQTLNSILYQDIDDLEIVIVDDCSTDGSYEHLCNLYGEDSRFIIRRNPYNMGVAATRNAAFALSSRNYIALLDSDDIWEDLKLIKQLKALKTSSAHICCTGAKVISHEGVFLNKYRCVEDNVSFDALLKNNMVVNSSVLMKREVMDKFKFRTDFFHEDYVFWLESLQNQFKLIGINEPLIKYRLGGRSQNKLNAAKHRWKIYREFLNFGLFKSLKYMLFYIKNAMAKQ